MNKIIEKETQSLIKKINLNCSVKEFAYKVDWFDICRWQKLSEKFIKEFSDKVDWFQISLRQKLSEKFIKEFSDKVSWTNISWRQKLSEKFIKEFAEKVDWYFISGDQKLSGKFIKEFVDKVDWYRISQYQKLSKKFIKEFSDKVEWYRISQYQKLSEKFIKEFDDKVYLKLIRSEHNWLYKTGDEKLKIVSGTGLYEIKGNYIIAYKSVSWNGDSIYMPSRYNFQEGKSYVSNADFNCSEEDSYGLSAWTKYDEIDRFLIFPEKLFKVKIHKNDLAACVHPGGKLRCIKLTILNEIEK